MILASIAVLVGLGLLVWSADRFVDGAAATAKHLGMPPLLIGMVIVGFGTSAPEMVVSANAALQGSPEIALGNAYGSNISNIALILGITAILCPITVHSQILRKELPILTLMTAFAAWQVTDLELTRWDGIGLLVVFGFLMGWTIWQGTRKRKDTLNTEFTQQMDEAQPVTLSRAIFLLVLGLIVLIASSRMLVWGAAEIARGFGVSELVIGLTVIAIGTSLPELASTLAATRKGEHDLALGNILGSNLFNTLAVVGIAASIHPLSVDAVVFNRDVLVMSVLTLSLFAIGAGFRKPGRINRYEGALLLAAYIAYTTYLVVTEVTIATT